MKVLGLALLAAVGSLQADVTRAELFANPPNDCRILPIHHGRPATKNVSAELDDLAANGFGGLTCNVNWSSNYLHDAAEWEVFVRTVREAQTRKMALWLYDEFGYPSGTAADLTLKGHPEWAARGLLVASTNVAAGASAALSLPPGLFRCAFACPLRRGNRPDCSRAVEVPQRGGRACGEPGTLPWTAPKGSESWLLVGVTEDFLYDNTHSAIALVRRERYINLLMAEPVKRFIELTHDAYAAHLGADLKAFTSTFTDEPSLMSVWSRKMPYRVLPYAPGLDADYASRTGRPLWADLPAIVFEDAQGASPMRRYAFWKMVGDRVEKNFVQQLTDWSTAHGILSGGHFLAEEGLTSHVGYYGDFFRCLRAMTAPGVDCLQGIPDRIPWLTPMFAGSARDLNDAPWAMCEFSDYIQRMNRGTYRVDRAETLGNANMLIWGGINALPTYHSMDAYTNAAEKTVLNLAVGRALALLKNTANAAEVALIYPAETMAAGYESLFHGSGGTMNVRAAETFRAAGELLAASGRPFMIADTRTLVDGRVEQDALVLGKLRFRMVVLPSCEMLPRKAMANLVAFQRAGGCVIALARPPCGTPETFPDEAMRSQAQELFISLPDASAAFLNRTLDATLEAPVSFGTNAPLYTAHRRGSEGDVLLLFNRSRQTWNGTVCLAGSPKDVECWYPSRSTHEPLKHLLSLAQFEACVLTTPTRLQGARKTFDSTLVLPQEHPLTTPPTVVTLSNARDVRARLERTAEGWRDSVRITKSDVDTFSFVRLALPRTAVPSTAQGLVFELRVPQSQFCSRTAYVFATDVNGTRFLQGTSIPMEEAGTHRGYVPFEAFRPFAQSSGKKGASRLVPERLVSVEIGFGGNFGTEGDEIVFEVLPPRWY